MGDNLIRTGYADDHTGTVPTKVLDLHAAKFTKEGDNIFHVICAHRDYVFRTSNLVEVDDWLRSLAVAVAAPTPPPTTATPTVPSAPTAAATAGATVTAAAPKTPTTAVAAPAAAAAAATTAPAAAQVTTPTRRRMDKSGWVSRARAVLKKGMMSSWRRRWLVASQWTLSTYATDEPGAIPTKVLDLHSAAFVKRDEDCMLLVKTDHREYVFQLENKDELDEWFDALLLASGGDLQGSSPTGSLPVTKPAVAGAAAELPAMASRTVCAPISVAASVPLLAGWLEKGGMLGTFHRRWAVLRRWSLATYKSDDPDAQPTKDLPLQGALVVMGEPLTITINTAHRTYTFRMSSQEEVEKWVQALHLATKEA